MATIVQTSAGNWKAVVRKARMGVRIVVKTFTRKVDAEAWARKTESEIERGVWRETGGADRMTLREGLGKYLDEIAVRHRGVGVERSNVAAILDREPLGNVTLERLGRGDILNMREKWERAGYAVGTINRRLTILHSMFDAARFRWKMESLQNPVDRTKLSGATERARRVTDDEIAAVISVSRSKRFRAAVRLGVETGMRRGEIAAMTWKMCDLDVGVVHLPASITKSSRARDVPLSPAAIAVISSFLPARRQPAAEGRVLGIADAHAITRTLARCAAAARRDYEADCAERGCSPGPGFLQDLHFHDLRHEAASRLAGVFEIHELMKVLGHQSPKMLMRYYHPAAEDFAARLRDHAAGSQPHKATR